LINKLIKTRALIFQLRFFIVPSIAWKGAHLGYLLQTVLFLAGCRWFTIRLVPPVSPPSSPGFPFRFRTAGLLCEVPLMTFRVFCTITPSAVSGLCGLPQDGSADFPGALKM